MSFLFSLVVNSYQLRQYLISLWDQQNVFEFGFLCLDVHKRSHALCLQKEMSLSYMLFAKTCIS